MIVSSPYPWQNEAWQRLLADPSKMPHALLLKGQSGIGKLDFASFLSKSLLCDQPNEHHQACGVCPSCGWFEQDNHPDFRLVSPEQDAGKDEDGPKSSKKKTQILIDQIRGLSDFLSLSSHKNEGLRIVLINPAEGLNLASGNALLKMLEEPPRGAMFILVAHQPQKILPTIMSRCQKIDMPVPSTQQALSWMLGAGIDNAEAILSYAGGSPLQAINEAEEGAIASLAICKQLTTGSKLDTFQVASACLALGMESALNALQKWSYDVFLCRMTGSVRYHPEHKLALQKLAQASNTSLLIDLLKKLSEAKKSATHPLNNELQLTRLLHHYTLVFNRPL